MSEIEDFHRRSEFSIVGSKPTSRALLDRDLCRASQSSALLCLARLAQIVL